MTAENSAVMIDIISITDIKYEQLLEHIENRIDEGVTKAAKTVLKHQLDTYWDTGRYIVEYEQDGLAHAEYGLELLKRLARDLTHRKGKGFSRSNLYAMRKFYQLYSEGYDEIKELTWSHICELINIDDELERNFYARECVSEKRSVRTLQRQKKSALFLRLATNKDKEGILELACKGVQIFEPKDIVKDTYTLEFLNIDEKKQYGENILQKM